MTVVIFTFHAYRSWKEDNPRGYIQHGKPGVQHPSERLARHRDAIATFSEVKFHRLRQKLIIEIVREVCESNQWRLHGVSVTPTHVHVVVSWRQQIRPAALSTKLKQMIGRGLAIQSKEKGRKWLSRGEDTTRIEHAGHLEYLLNKYLPSHVEQRGTVWIEGRGIVETV